MLLGCTSQSGLQERYIPVQRQELAFPLVRPSHLQVVTQGWGNGEVDLLSPSLGLRNETSHRISDHGRNISNVKPPAGVNKNLADCTTFDWMLRKQGSQCLSRAISKLRDLESQTIFQG